MSTYRWSSEFRSGGRLNDPVTGLGAVDLSTTIIEVVPRSALLGGTYQPTPRPPPRSSHLAVAGSDRVSNYGRGHTESSRGNECQCVRGMATARLV